MLVYRIKAGRLRMKMKKRIRRIVNKAKGAFKNRMYYTVVPRAYKKAAVEPICSDKVLFVEATRTELSNSLQLMYEMLRDEYGMDVEFISQGLNRLSLVARYFNEQEVARKIATARFVVICEASELVGCLPLREETEIVQLWHGCGAFKKFGMSTAEKKFGGNRTAKLRHPLYNNVSLVTISSPEVKWAYVEAMSLEETPDIVQPIGVSRTDVFFDERYLSAARDEAARLVPDVINRKVIAYAPTFRGTVAHAAAPDKLDLHAMKDALADEYVLLIKHHPHVRVIPAIPEDCRDFAFQVTDTMSIETLMAIADVCITDYSSLIFEYSLLERPMVFFAYDRDSFDDWRGFYYDYDDMTPGPVFTESQEVVDYLLHLDERFDKGEIVAFRERFMSSCDGQSTKRICDMMLGETIPAHLSGQDRRASEIAVAMIPPKKTFAKKMKGLKRKAYRRATKRARKRAREYLVSDYVSRKYRELASEKPIVAGKVIFYDEKSEAMPDSFGYLNRYLNKNYSFDTQYYYLDRKSGGVRDLRDRVDAAVEVLADAEYIFLQDASRVVSSLPLRSETTVVQLWHGCGAFKKWGMSTANLKFGGSRQHQIKHPNYGNLSLVTTSSPEVNWAYIEAMNLEEDPDVVQAIGVSRTDIFHNDDFVANARERVERALPICIGKKIVLYAPTFRGRVAKAQAPDRLDIRAMRRALAGEYVLVIKHHPFVKHPPAVPSDCVDFAVITDDRLHTDTLLAACDVCVSDYSSLIFEYSLLSKPLVFLAYDKDDYDDWRGFYYDYNQLTPGPVLKTTMELIDFIVNVDERFDLDQMGQFRDRFMNACDGLATWRLCERVFGKELEEHRLRRTWLDDLREEHPDRIDVSIIMASYNTMPFIREAVSSVIKQTFPHERMELIVVDDCSTDGSWEYLCGVRERYPELVRCIRLERNSGSPSEPRNAGLQVARGEYVFFLDSDDTLHYRAVARMLRRAIKWNSDVLLVKMKALNGRVIAMTPFQQGNVPSLVNVFRSSAVWSFSSEKLFRRSLVEDLRFPPFMPEDISFVLRAYDRARTVSVAADYDYLFAREWSRGTQQSFNTWEDPESNLAAVEDLLGYISANIDSAHWNYGLMRRLFQRDVHNMLEKAARMPYGEGAAYHERLVKLCSSFYTEEMYRSCLIERRFVLDAGLLGDFDLLRKVVSIRDAHGGFSPVAHLEQEGDTLRCVLRYGDFTFPIVVNGGVRTIPDVDYVEEEQPFDPAVFTFGGSLKVTTLLLDDIGVPEVSVIARRPGGVIEACWPCDIELSDEVDGDTVDRKTIGTWRARIELADVAHVFFGANDAPAAFDDDQDDDADSETGSDEIAEGIDESPLGGDEADGTDEDVRPRLGVKFYCLTRIGDFSRVSQLHFVDSKLRAESFFGRKAILVDPETSEKHCVKFLRMWHRFKLKEVSLPQDLKEQEGQ